MLVAYRSYLPVMYIAMVNAKGGVGKRTLAVHLAVWLHEQGRRVILVDCDLQRSSSQWLAEAEPGVRVVVVMEKMRCLSRPARCSVKLMW